MSQSPLKIQNALAGGNEYDFPSGVANDAIQVALNSLA